MEVKIESKIGRISSDEQHIYAFLSDCNHFRELGAGDRVKNWQSDSESCSFTVDGAGDVNIRIVERRPCELIKFSVENAQAENMFLWIQLKSVNPSDSRVKLTAKMDVNPVLKMLISKPVKQGLDKIVDILEKTGR